MYALMSNFKVLLLNHDGGDGPEPFAEQQAFMLHSVSWMLLLQSVA